MPESIRPTVSNALEMLAEGHTKSGPTELDEPLPAESILRLSDLRDLGRPGECIATLGNVLIRYFVPADHPVVILIDLLWIE